jgi:hypothetical protein
MKSLDKTGNVLLFLMFLIGRTCPEISSRSSDRKKGTLYKEYKKPLYISTTYVLFPCLVMEHFSK